MRLLRLLPAGADANLLCLQHLHDLLIVVAVLLLLPWSLLAC